MKTKTIYIAEDGERFDDLAACQKYEADGCVEFNPLPNYGEHEPLTEQALSWMSDGDGSCYYATKDSYAPNESIHGTPHPVWATHLIYFGK